MASPPTYSAASIDYRALLTHLSRAPQLPSASSTRNQLLSHFCSRDALAGAAADGTEADADPWASLQRFRPGSSTYLLGAVPAALLLPHAQVPAHAGQEALWAVLHIYTSPGATNARINLWLSSEPSLPSSSSASASRFSQEQRLLRHVLRLLPPAIASLRAAGSLPPAQEQEPLSATLCSLERTWLDLICGWAHVEPAALQPLRQPQPTQAPGAPDAPAAEQARQSSGLKVTWANPCITYQCAAELLRLPEAAEHKRWKIARIEGEGEMELIRTSNKIPFPRAYVASRTHLSVFIRDLLGPAPPSDAAPAHTPASDVYPTSQAAGHAAGFVYAHEELSLGALHVCAPYRRLTSTPGTSVGIGRLLLAQMAPLLRSSISTALRRAGVPEVREEACQVSADTEVTSGAAGFFERCGMRRVRETAWAGIELLPEVETRQ